MYKALTVPQDKYDQVADSLRKFKISRETNKLTLSVQYPYIATCISFPISADEMISHIQCGFPDNVSKCIVKLLDSIYKPDVDITLDTIDELLDMSAARRCSLLWMHLV